MQTFPLNNHIDITLNWTWFTKHTHGPKTWPWWRLVVLHVAWWPGESTNVQAGFNLWVYTRWGAWCHGVSWPKVIR